MSLRARLIGFVFALVVAASLLSLTSAPAVADRPVDSHNGGLVALQCDELGELQAGYTTAGEWVHAAEPRLVFSARCASISRRSSGLKWRDALMPDARRENRRDV